LSNMYLLLRQVSMLYYICRVKSHDYHLRCLSIRKSATMDLASHYGDDFLHIHKIIATELNKPNGNGLVLLHGLPGTGKK
jgi:hypothetical protein